MNYQQSERIGKSRLQLASCAFVYDMLKAADKAMIIRDVRLLEKTGGKSGYYKA